MQRTCGTCVNCQKPHFKKGCIKLKAIREADRASHHEAPPRRHRQSVDAIPLAKLAQQPGATPASPSSQQPASLSAPLLRGSSPAVDPDAEAQGDRNWPENNKRAGTEDSENQGCQKKIRFAAEHDKEPVHLPNSGMASRDTPDDSFDSELLRKVLILHPVLPCYCLLPCLLVFSSATVLLLQAAVAGGETKRNKVNLDTTSPVT